MRHFELDVGDRIALPALMSIVKSSLEYALLRIENFPSTYMVHAPYRTCRSARNTVLHRLIGLNFLTSIKFGIHLFTEQP